jgi:hypothetical protein
MRPFAVSQRIPHDSKRESAGVAGGHLGHVVAVVSDEHITRRQVVLAECGPEVHRRLTGLFVLERRARRPVPSKVLVPYGVRVVARNPSIERVLVRDGLIVDCRRVAVDVACPP